MDSEFRLYKELNDRSRDADPDIRFMAVNDLEKALESSQNFPNNRVLVRNVLFRLIDDVNPEVKNQTVKVFKPLAKLSEQKFAEDIVSRLVALVAMSDKQQSEMVISVATCTMALKEYLQALEYSKELENCMEIICKEFLANNKSVIVSFDWAEILHDYFVLTTNHQNMDTVKQIAAVVVRSAFLCYESLSGKCIKLLGLMSSVLDVDSDTGFTRDLLAKLISSRERYPGLSSLNYETIRCKILQAITANSRVSLDSQLQPVCKVVMSNLHLGSLGQDSDESDSGKIDELRDISLTVLDNLLQSTSSLLNYVDIFDIVSKCVVYDSLNIDYDDDDVMSDDEDIDFSDDDYEDFGEVDDISWRIRKEATKIIGTIAQNAPSEYLSKIFENGIFQLLLTRLKDKNEAVVVEILTVLTIFFEKIGNSTFEPKSKLTAFIPNISEALNKHIPLCKSPASLTPFLKFATTVVTLVGSKFNTEDVDSLLAAILQFKSSQDKPFFDESLGDLYYAILESHSLVGLKSKINPIIDDLSFGLFSGTRSMSLYTIPKAVLLVQNMAKHCVDHRQYPGLEEMINTVAERACSKSYDSEQREKFTSFLMVVFTDLKLSNCEPLLSVLSINILYDSLSEFTLVAARKGLSTVIVNDVPQSWLISFVNSLMRLMEGSPTQSKESLAVLHCIVRNGELSGKLDADIHVKIIESLLLKQFYEVGTSSEKLSIISYSLANIRTINISLASQIVDLIRDSCNMALPSAKPLARLADSLADKGDPSSLIDELTSGEGYWDLKHLPEVLSAITFRLATRTKVAKFEHALVSQSMQEPQLIFLVKYLGDVSRYCDLDLDLQVFLDLFAKYKDNAQVRPVILQSIGKFISKDLKRHLPRVMGLVDQSESESFSYWLYAIKEELDADYRDILLHKSHILADDNAATIWAAIMGVQSHENSLNIKELSICSEILTFIILKVPSTFERVERYLAEGEWSSVSMNYLCLNIVNLLINQDFFKGSFEFLESPELVNFIKYCQVLESLEVKQIVTSLLISIIRRDCNNYFEKGIFEMVFDNLLKEMEPHKEFIRKIQIGTYKRKIDDGIELRKSCYEFLLYVLNQDVWSESNMPLVSQIVEKAVTYGLKDASDIISLANTIVVASTKIRSTNFFGNSAVCQLFVDKSVKILEKKLDEKATGQQINEKEKNKSAVLETVAKLDEMKSGVVPTVWVDFVSTVQKKYSAKG